MSLIPGYTLYNVTYMVQTGTSKTLILAASVSISKRQAIARGQALWSPSLFKADLIVINRHMLGTVWCDRQITRIEALFVFVLLFCSVIFLLLAVSVFSLFDYNYFSAFELDILQWVLNVYTHIVSDRYWLFTSPSFRTILFLEKYWKTISTNSCHVRVTSSAVWTVNKAIIGWNDTKS